MREMRFVELGGGVEGGIFIAVVVIEVCFSPKRIKAMDLVEDIDAGSVCLTKPEALRISDGLVWIFADSDNFFARDRDWPLVRDPSPRLVDLRTRLTPEYLISGRGEQGGVHPFSDQTDIQTIEHWC